MSSDAGPWPGSDASAGCSGKPGATFCDDFDTEALPSDKWTTAMVTAPGHIGFDTTHYLSSPHAFLASIPASTLVSLNADLRYLVNAAPTAITVDFDVYPTTQGNVDSASIVEMVVGDGPTASYATLYAQQSKLWVQLFDSVHGPSGSQEITVLDAGLPPDAWTHVTFSLELTDSGTGATVSVDIAGLRSIDKTPLSQSFPRKATTIGVGLNNINASHEAWSFSFDNVAIGVK